MNSEITIKEKLYNLLESYKNILSKDVIEYLKYLIELDISAVNDTSSISVDDKKLLLQFDIYREIAKYNIYYRALKLLNIISSKFPYDTDSISLIAKINTIIIKIFDFDYQNPNNIGTIKLYQTIIDEKERNAEIERIKKRLEFLYDFHNPKIAFNHLQNHNFSFLKNEEIDQLNRRINELQHRNPITLKKEFEIEKTKELCELFLDDYGIKEEEFTSLESKNRGLQRSLVVKKPGLVVEKKISLY